MEELEKELKEIKHNRKVTIELLERRIKINKKLLEYAEPNSMQAVFIEIDIARCENTIKCFKCRNDLQKAKKLLERASSNSIDHWFRYELDRLIIDLDELISFFN